MKLVPLLLFLPLFSPVAALAARPLAKPALREDGRYEFRDQGSTSKFRIVTDELEESGPNGSRPVTVSAKASLRAMQATAHQMSGGRKKMNLVAYAEDQPATEANRRTVTEQVAVTLNEGVDPTSIGLAAGAIAMREIVYSPRDYVLSFNDATEALTAAEALRILPGITSSSVLLGQKMYPCFIPNDPYFYTSNTNLNYVNEIGAEYAELRTQQNPRLVLRFSRAFQWYLGNSALFLQTPLYLSTTYQDKELPSFVNTINSRRYPKYFDGEVDLNTIRAWDIVGPSGNPVDGTGVTVGIVDDGIYKKHPDFVKSNILAGMNLLDGAAKKEEPDVPLGGPTHGTNMAGIILANRNNGIGISGVAPNAKLFAVRAIGASLSEVDRADALVPGSTALAPTITDDNPFGLPKGNEWRKGKIKVDISVNAWSYFPFGADLIGIGPYLRKSLVYGVTEGRVVNGSARGVVFITAAGNQGESHDNVNHFGLTNSMYTLTVGSVTDIGRRAIYSNPGASLYAVAPSNGPEIAPRILVGSTDVIKPAVIPPPVPTEPWKRALGWTLSPDEWDHKLSTPRFSQDVLTLRTPTIANPQGYYNSGFGGTSASCAMAAGVVALMLEANPRLGWRDVQEIIMRSARVIDPMMGEWQYNHLGMPMSHKYGAGLIDAEKAIRMAQVWENLGSRGATTSLTDSYFYKEDVGEVNRLIQSQGIPNNEFKSETKKLLVTSVPAPSAGLRLEHVVVRLRIRHGRRGDLGIILSSPKSGQSDGPVESYLFVPHREDFNANIGKMVVPDRATGITPPVQDSDYWDFMTVQHWGSGSQNQALDTSSSAGGAGPWTLTVWDNTQKGIVNSTTPIKADFNNPLPEDRVTVNVPDPVNSNEPTAKILSAQVIYHGSTIQTNNEAPVILNNGFLGQTAKPLSVNVRAVTDLSIQATRPGPRAPITDYRIRPLGSPNPNAPEMIIGPSTAAEYLERYPANTPTASKPYLRFDRSTGLLTNAPYPPNSSFPPDLKDPLNPKEYVYFRPLPKQSWLLELRATNIFGMTRKQVLLNVKDRLTYAEWKLIYGITDDKADPDFDGVPNLLEYGMGGNPIVKEPNLLPKQEIIDSNMVFTYQVDLLAARVAVTPEISAMLNSLPTWSALTPVIVSTDGDLQVRKVSFPIVPGTRNFFRLRSIPN